MGKKVCFMNHRKKGYFLVILAATLWGIMGVFTRGLVNIGYSSYDTAFIRCISAGVIYFVIQAVKKPSVLKIDFKGFVICFLYGLISYGFSFICYSVSVERIPIAVATVLMFMSPIWVALLSVFLLKEQIKKDKIITIIICLLGACMVSNIFSVKSTALDLIGVFAGVCNGFGVALQILVPKYFASRYERDTMLVYGFLGAALGLVFLTDFSTVYDSFFGATALSNLVHIFGLGVLCTMVANVSMVKSTLYIDATTASILSALEVVVGAVVGIFIFSEFMSPIQILGSVVVILGALGPGLLERHRWNKVNQNDENNNLS